MLGGLAFGWAMIASYHGFMRLPALVFEITPWSALLGAVISFGAASLGVMTAVRNIVAMAPAVAMQPPAPLRFRHSWIEGIWAGGRLAPRRMMMFRNFAGRPLRSALTVAVVALAVPMVALGLFWRDAIDHMIDVQFHLVERGNMTIAFAQPHDRKIIRDLGREPGVLAAEGQRTVPVRLRAGQRTYLTSLIGLSAGSELRRPHDAALRPVDVSTDGVTLSRRLAERLGVGPGDNIAVEVLEGRRSKLDLPVSASVDEVIGMASYMELDALNRLTGEGAVVSAAALFVDPSSLPALAQRLKELPVADSVAMKALTLTPSVDTSTGRNAASCGRRSSLPAGKANQRSQVGASFIDKIAGLVLVSSAVLTAFAIIIAVAVIYNGARVGLQERARELASLRVLGFTRGEVASILFGQFAIEMALGIPIGLALSKAVVNLIARFHSNESFQIPAVIEPRTYAAAAFIVISTGAASAYVVRRRIDRLDLVAVLKTRD